LTRQSERLSGREATGQVLPLALRLLRLAPSRQVLTLRHQALADVDYQTSLATHPVRGRRRCATEGAGESAERDARGVDPRSFEIVLASESRCPDVDARCAEIGSCPDTDSRNTARRARRLCNNVTESNINERPKGKLLIDAHLSSIKCEKIAQAAAAYAGERGISIRSTATSTPPKAEPD
jgi:hypothetical protein